MAQKEPTDFRGLTIGGILVEMGIVTEAQLQTALAKCAPDHSNLGDVLVSLGYVTEDKFLKTVSLRQGIPYFTSFAGLLDPALADLIPEETARKYLVVPFMRTEDSLTIGMVNPLDLTAIDEISTHTGLKVLPVLTTLSNLFDSVVQLYKDKKPAPVTARKTLRKAKEGEDEAEQSAVDALNSIMEEAIARKASDIHIEAGREQVRVRYRLDGVLQESHSLPKEMEVSLTARVKILSKLDITETRTPQDGRFRYSFGGIEMDVRVSTLPSIYGEKMALRLLNPGGLKKLADIGMEAGTSASYLAAIRQPNGIVLVTGPTGSGKTSTLYSTLAELNVPTRHIITLEDPVEYRMEGVNQIEVNAKVGMSFAAGLRSILRQDPNIILVGEIRDLETAEIAIQAAITGHMVFSTLHTNDAASAVHRLVNIKVEPFLLAVALRAVLAQRLVRRLCERCKTKYAPTAAEQALLGSNNAGTFFAPAGCATCFQTGYQGRMAIYELLSVNAQIRDLIAKGASVDELRAAAKAGGMRTLQQDALDKARAGLTSIAEVLVATRVET